MDMRTKFAHAHTIVTKYKGPIFANKGFPLAKKVELFNALVLSTIVFNLAAWHVLSAIETRHFVSGFLRLFRRIAQMHFGSSAFHWTAECTYARLQLPPPDVLLRTARLRYLQQLARNGPDQLWGILQLDGAWWRLVETDLAWMQGQIPDFAPAPTLRNWQELLPYLRKPGQAWKAAIKKATRLHVAYSTLQWKWGAWHQRLLETLCQHGFYTPSVVELSAGQHICMPCRKRFARAAARAVHAFKCHGRVKYARTVAQGTQCVACLKQYANNVSLVNHLTYSAQCLAHYQTTGVQATLGPGLNSRKELHSRRPLHLPHQQAQGPLNEPLIALRPDDPDYISCSQTWSQAWLDAEGQPTENKLHCLRLCTERLIVPFADLPHHLARWILEKAECESTTVDIFAAGQQLLEMLRPDNFLANEKEPDTCHTKVDATAILAAWDFDYRPRLGCTRQVPYQPVVVAHLFSGRRREGDLQSHLESWHGSLEGAKVMSIDIIFHPTLGDMLNPATQLLFRRAIAAGVLHAIVCGPPCETWTIARHHDSQGPRPVRSAEIPSGLPGLRHKELRQLSIGNELLGIAVLLFLDCLIFGAFMLLEHPEEPWSREDAASIWRLDAIRILASFSNCSVAHVLQGHFGAPSAKPTRFLLANSTPDFEEIFVAHRTSVYPPQKSSIGRHADGTWKTACLKEYPSALCRAMTHVIEDSLSRRTFQTPAEDIAWFHEAVEALCRDFNLEANMGPDFAGWTLQ